MPTCYLSFLVVTNATVTTLLSSVNTLWDWLQQLCGRCAVPGAHAQTSPQPRTSVETEVIKLRPDNFYVICNLCIYVHAISPCPSLISVLRSFQDAKNREGKCSISFTSLCKLVDFFAHLYSPWGWSSSVLSCVAFKGATGFLWFHLLKCLNLGT